MTTVDLQAAVRAILDGGAGDPLPGAGDRFLPLVTLDSGARLGLDGEARWVLVPDDGRAAVRWDDATAHLFHEPLEWKRSRFDDAVEDAARGAGLPPEAVVDVFPAIEIARAVLAKQVDYLTRLALLWLRPSELRPLRKEILAVARARETPAPLRDLAERLVVPE